MKPYFLTFFILKLSFQISLTQKNDNAVSTTYLLPIPAHMVQTNQCYNSGLVLPNNFCVLPPIHPGNFGAVLEANPLLAAFYLSQNLNVPPKKTGFNHVDHLPLNPYVALLLSHYGKYAPVFGKGRGLYGYVAANNYHNNLPIGAYKVHDDRDGG